MNFSGLVMEYAVHDEEITVIYILTATFFAK